jgi:ferredoxin
MRIVVDEETCDRHGQCMIACPEVFKLVDPETLRYEPHPAESLRDDVEAALNACPTQSIRIEK